MENKLKMESRWYRLTGKKPLLGTWAANPEIYREYILSKAPEGTDEVAPREIEGDGKGLTVFPTDPAGNICVRGYQIKGFFKAAFKAAAEQLGVANAKSKVDTLIFVEPDYIPITRAGEKLKQADGYNERPLRAETPMGPRTALSCSEQVDAPWTLDIEISLLPNKGSARSKPVDWDVIETALGYGEYSGLCQWRNAGYGQFWCERIEDESEE